MNCLMVNMTDFILFQNHTVPKHNSRDYSYLSIGCWQQEESMSVDWMQRSEYLEWIMWM